MAGLEDTITQSISVVLELCHALELDHFTQLAVGGDLMIQANSFSGS